MTPQHGDWDERACECELCAHFSITRPRPVRWDAGRGKWLCYWSWHAAGRICGVCLQSTDRPHRGIDQEPCDFIPTEDGYWSVPPAERPPGLRET